MALRESLTRREFNNLAPTTVVALRGRDLLHPPGRQAEPSIIVREIGSFTQLEEYFNFLNTGMGIADIYDPNTSEDYIRGKRDEAIETLSPKRVRMVISQSVWNNIANGGKRKFGTNRPEEWLAANIYDYNRMLREADITDELILEEILKVPDAVASEWEALYFKSEEEGPRQRGNWRCHYLGANKVFAQHPKDDILWIFSQNMGDYPSTSGWMVWRYIPELGKNINVDEGLNHEIVHLGHGVGDLYRATGYMNIPGAAEFIFANTRDIMSDPSSVRITPATRHILEAVRRNRPDWRSVLSDKLPFIPNPHLNMKLDNPYLIFNWSYHIGFFDPSNNSLHDRVIDGYLLRDMVEAAERPWFNPAYYTGSDLPQGYFGLDAYVGAWPYADPDKNHIGVWHVAYRVGNLVIPFPRLALNIAAINSLYTNPDFRPNFDIRFRQNPDSITSFNAWYVDMVKGKPVDQDGIVATCQIPGTDTFIVWANIKLENIPTTDVFVYRTFLPVVVAEFVGAGQAEVAEQEIAVNQLQLEREMLKRRLAGGDEREELRREVERIRGFEHRFIKGRGHNGKEDEIIPIIPNDVVE